MQRMVSRGGPLLFALAFLAGGCETTDGGSGGGGPQDAATAVADGAQDPGHDGAPGDAAPHADAAAPVDATPPDAGEVDAACPLRTWYRDQDDDSRGDPADSKQACAAPPGYVNNPNDTQPTCPTDDADECGVCHGSGPATWYADADGDGLGDPDETRRACQQPDGYVDNADDAEPRCQTNDTDECGVCGGPGPRTVYADRDGDGLGDPRESRPVCGMPPQGFVANSDDAEPGCATNDTDECGVCAGSGPRPFYADADDDGLGDPAVSMQGCDAPDGFVDNANDAEPRCQTNNTDECGVCAGAGPRTWYGDADGDGLGDPHTTRAACGQPQGFVANHDDAQPDCATNDTDVCGVCHGPGRHAYYVDLDGDGLGDPATRVFQCQRPGGGNFVDNGDDPEPACATNDTDECGVCAGTGPSTWYADTDGDGLGDPAVSRRACHRPNGYVANHDDPQPNCRTNDCMACMPGQVEDCAGVCGGAATLDRCNVCSGGSTGRAPSVADGDQDGIPDACDECPRGQSARLIVQWTDVPPYSAERGGPFTFQIVLFANGDFAYYYQAGHGAGQLPTVGYQGAAGADAVDLGYDANRRVAYFRADHGQRVLDATQPYAWTDIRYTGTPLRLDDDGTADVPLDFAYPFERAGYQSVTVSANGFLAFAGPLGSFTNDPLPDAQVGPMLAGLWMDLNPSAGGTVYFQKIAGGCEQDCAGQFGGVAALDGCGTCYGGSTGHGSDADVDCNGDCGGVAYADACGNCVGGNTGREPQDPATCPHEPDLLVDPDYLRQSLVLDHIDAEDQCLIEERCIGGTGLRKVLRFGTRIANVGSADLRLGAPGDNNLWEFSQCHQHWHYRHYAAYDLFDVAHQQLLPIGAKNGFAVIDIGVYDPQIATTGCRGYNGNDQGITAGCYDAYSSNLQCQWIDITGVPDGTYDVIVTTNPDHVIPELSYDNNSATVRVQIQGDNLQILP
jgi:hypothetical protein